MFLHHLQYEFLTRLPDERVFESNESLWKRIFYSHSRQRFIWFEQVHRGFLVSKANCNDWFSCNNTYSLQDFRITHVRLFTQMIMLDFIVFKLLLYVLFASFRQVESLYFPLAEKSVRFTRYVLFHELFSVPFFSFLFFFLWWCFTLPKNKSFVFACCVVQYFFLNECKMKHGTPQHIVLFQSIWTLIPCLLLPHVAVRSVDVSLSM